MAEAKSGVCPSLCRARCALEYSTAERGALVSAMQSLPDCSAGIFCQNSINILCKEFLSSVHRPQQVALFFPQMHLFGVW